MEIKHIEQFLKDGDESWNSKAIPKWWLVILLVFGLPYSWSFSVLKLQLYLPLLLMLFYSLWTIWIWMDRRYFLQFSFLYRGIGLSLPILLCIQILCYMLLHARIAGITFILLILLATAVVWLTIKRCRRRIITVYGEKNFSKHNKNSITQWSLFGSIFGILIARVIFSNASQATADESVFVAFLGLVIIYLFCSTIFFYKFHLFRKFRQELTLDFD